MKKLIAIPFLIVAGWTAPGVFTSKTPDTGVSSAGPNVISEKRWDPTEVPALVVGIMIDQMRPDYLTRYWNHFGDDGFRRLIGEGFTFANTHFDYLPTKTGPGHASVYTGTTPAIHGVTGNSWYDRDLDRFINVVEVPGYTGVGSLPGYDSKAPSNMLVTTFGDELRLHTNNRSRVIGISRKDRGAILPAGHLGQAYWYESDTGNFITSSYYRDSLPQWLIEFNDRQLPQKFLSGRWETVMPIHRYVESIADDNPYEGLYDGLERAVFPYDLAALVREHGHDPGLLSDTPFGNELLTELAIAVIEGESLGSGPFPDVLALSWSATDAIGHQFGPASVEIQDTYLRLDREIARLLNYLDEKFGKEKILLFVTSDHGAAHVPNYLTDLGIPGGTIDEEGLEVEVRNFLRQRYGKDFLLAISNEEIFLDHHFMMERGMDHGEVQRELARFMTGRAGIAGALTAEALSYSQFIEGVKGRAQRGFHPKRSGDVRFWMEPHTIYERDGGTTHGSPWAYDTHAPMHWYGWKIPHGRSSQPVNVTDIAPTISTLLGIPFPSGAVGQPMDRFMKGESIIY